MLYMLVAFAIGYLSFLCGEPHEQYGDDKESDEVHWRIDRHMDALIVNCWIYKLASGREKDVCSIPYYLLEFYIEKD